MLKVFKRTLTKDLKVSKGIWSDFSKRPESLKLQQTTDLPSIINNNKPKYHSPLLIDETFEKAYNLLQDESAELYKAAEASKDPKEKDDLLAAAERQNPEVLFNLMKESKLDLSQPVYRQHAERKWKDYDLMILMQRLEQLKVIPDTMPTLDPKVDVKIKFPHVTKPVDKLNSWITPGEILPSFLVNQPPVIKIQRFDSSNEPKKYTVVLVNPDEPDLDTNSFKTKLHFGIANLPIDLHDNTLNIEKYLSENLNIFKDYVPILPEINSGDYQRACLWVFEQQDAKDLSIDSTQFSSETFDIRKFADAFALQAVGAHVWRQVFDRSVNDVRNQYGLPKGRVFHRVRKPFPVK